MKTKFSLYIPILISLVLTGCNSPREKSSDHPESIKLEGKYLVPDLLFPQDTLFLTRFNLSDSLAKEQLMVEFKNDSIFLSSYNFNMWDGKWISDFHKGAVKINDSILHIEADTYSTNCANKNTWRHIDYLLETHSDQELMFIKVKDTSNCDNLINRILSTYSLGQTIDPSALAAAKNSLEKNNTYENQVRFFTLFPNTFNELQETFGYTNDEPAPLYDGYEFIELFFALDSISESEHMHKCISIAKNGSWEADAVNYFQHNLRVYTLQRTELLYRRLKPLRAQEIESFFTFYFDGVHGYQGGIPSEFDFLIETDNDFYNIILVCHERSNTRK